MKTLIIAFFASLLLFGCGSSDLDDPKTLDDIIAEAIDEEKLQKRGKEGEELIYAPNEQTPYSGWSKKVYDNGQIKFLYQFKGGKLDGLFTNWYENGQKKVEENLKDGKLDGLSTLWFENGQKKSERNYKDDNQHGSFNVWYENGQKKAEGNAKDGKQKGFFTNWYENGQKRFEENYKDGKIISAVAWKPNGEKCHVSNIDKNGNGVTVFYYDDGREGFRSNYSNGVKVED